MKAMIKSKVGIIICILVFFTGIITGCSKSDKTILKTPEVSQIEELVMKGMDTTDMIKLDNKKLERVYGIKSEEIEEYFVYVSTSNVKADEVAVFKTKDASGAEYVKTKIADRMVQLGTSFKDYLPEQYTFIEKHMLEVKGNYVFLVVSKDGKEIKAAFDKCFE
ncbi:MAG: hypothetical protein K0R09_2305 [Clostridiales bacterium]|jgi:hypothetical protein|nr:hypothetical protein [Clostridiales bacterium]